MHILVDTGLKVRTRSADSSSNDTLGGLSGVCQRSVRGLSGVCQGSVRGLSGVCQGSPVSSVPQLLHLSLKKSKVNSSEASALEMLDPFIQLMLDCLDSMHVKVTMTIISVRIVIGLSSDNDEFWG